MNEKLIVELNDLVSVWTGCADCILYKKRNSQVWFRIEGDLERNGLMIIGEAPGEEEDKEGEPFVGRSGARMNRLISGAGIKDVFITNTILCRPPNNRNPRRPELKACWPRLHKTIEVVKPSAIVCAGSIAAHWLLEIDKSMGSMMTKVYKWRLGRRWQAKVLPIYHPAYLLRKNSRELEKSIVDRLRLAREIAQDG
jgi:DNA polymerase